MFTCNERFTHSCWTMSKAQQYTCRGRCRASGSRLLQGSRRSAGRDHLLNMFKTASKLNGFFAINVSTSRIT